MIVIRIRMLVSIRSQVEVDIIISKVAEITPQGIQSRRQVPHQGRVSRMQAACEVSGIGPQPDINDRRIGIPHPQVHEAVRGAMDRRPGRHLRPPVSLENTVRFIPGSRRHG